MDLDMTRHTATHPVDARPAPSLRDQIIAGLIAYEQAEAWAREADPRHGWCGCSGAADGEPFCGCVMQRMQDQADAILAHHVHPPS